MGEKIMTKNENIYFFILNRTISFDETTWESFVVDLKFCTDKH